MHWIWALESNVSADKPATTILWGQQQHTNRMQLNNNNDNNTNTQL